MAHEPVLTDPYRSRPPSLILLYFYREQCVLNLGGGFNKFRLTFVIGTKKSSDSFLSLGHSVTTVLMCESGTKTTTKDDKEPKIFIEICENRKNPFCRLISEICFVTNLVF